jgi:hypothetical protein
MNTERPEQPLHDPLADLERALIDEFLRARGHSLSSLRELPPEQATTLLKEASLYASSKMTEVESRAHYVDELHHGPD